MFKQLELGGLADTFESMTENEVWLAGLCHLIAQGKQSLENDLDEDALCVYSSPNNCTCAAGPFVKNYDEKMETHGWSFLVSEYNQSSKYSDVIFILQTIHDASSNWFEKSLDWDLVKKIYPIPSEVIYEIDKMMEASNAV